MLTHLQISDFTLVKRAELNLKRGLTVLTGETGAGKSLLLDALGMALGDRAEADKVRPGARQAEVSASFEVFNLPHVKKWLNDAELDDQECIVRRVVSAEGRSRAFVNGRPVTLTQLRALGERLLDLHSQHEHQSLLKLPTHRRLLDAFGRCEGSVEQVKAAFNHWHALAREVAELQANSEELNARYQLLSYQVEELDQLNLAPGELEQLESRQRQLAHAEEIKLACEQVSSLCVGDDHSLEDQLHQAMQKLAGLPEKGPRLEEVAGMLHSALIQVQEAGRELSGDMLELGDDDVFQLPEIELRLSAIYDIARKHRVSAESLNELHERLATELRGLSSGDAQLEQKEAQLAQAFTDYRAAAELLSAARAQAAKSLMKAVNKQLAALAMQRAHLEIALTPNSEPSRYGNEQVEFLISTVPGQPPKPLGKIASGGELSRISLAIQVVTASVSVIPVLVFDEVDVGIGGATGDVVGQLLRELGSSAQVLCVTHLAQVASKAHQHLRVEKKVTAKGASTGLLELDGEAKVAEIARMMGGMIDSEQSLAHAREMLTATEA